MSTSIIVAPPKMKPAPTKAEVIEAAVQVRLQEFAKEKAAANAKIERLNAVVKRKLVVYARTLPLGSVLSASYYEWSGSHCVKFEVLGEFPEGIKSLLREINEMSRIARTSIDEKTLRKRIRDSLSNTASNSERISALMANKETRKALLDLSGE